VSERFHAGPFEAAGITFRVESNRHDLADRVSAALRDLTVNQAAATPVVFEVLHRGTPPPANPWAVWRDGEPRQTTVAEGYVLVYLLWEVSRLMFERTGDRVHLHGAALTCQGRALVLAGRSHAGKSTLAGWLTHRGWGFLTDEAALVEPESLAVLPFWRPIGVRPGGPLDAVLHDRNIVPGNDLEWLVPASAIGTLADAAPLAHIAFPSLVPNEPAALVPLSPAAALMELTQHFPGLIAGGRAGFRRLARVVEAVPAHTLRFHDLDEAEQALRGLLTGAGG
jgi:hypothetical protein